MTETTATGPTPAGEQGQPAGRHSRPSASRSRPVMPPSVRRPSTALVTLTLLLAVSYGFRWRWTGFGDNAELWNLLHLLMLPVVLSALPLWWRTHDRWAIEWRLALGAVAAAFAVVLVGGYALNWAWTGFAGNTLWDWLHLLVLPVVVAALPVWLKSRGRQAGEWRTLLVAGSLSFAVLLVGGYGLDWTWTGFAGNTLWDWLNLLLVPFALPIAVTWLSAQPAPASGDAPAAAEPG